MKQGALGGILKELGYTEEQVSAQLVSMSFANIFWPGIQILGDRASVVSGLAVCNKRKLCTSSIDLVHSRIQSNRRGCCVVTSIYSMSKLYWISLTVSTYRALIGFHVFHRFAEVLDQPFLGFATGLTLQ